MTHPIPLTGSALEIQRRLEAGQSVDFIAHVGWYRTAWSREDVLAVAIYRRELARAQEAEDDRIASAHHLGEPSDTPVRWDVCGSYKGVRRHQKEGEPPCEPCRVARNDYQNGRRRKDGAA